MEVDTVTASHLETVLMACEVVAGHQPAAPPLAFLWQALSPLGTIDLGGAGECACRCGLGSVPGGRSKHTADGMGRASPCGCAVVSGWSWCTDNADSGAASAQRSTAK